MGGHWGTSSGSSDRGTVRASAVADALENWTYSTSPSTEDAVTRRLSRAFPDATVRRCEGAAADDVRVDDVRVVIAHGLDSAFRRDLHTLADRFDDVVVYSTTAHASSPNEWREFRHRYRGRHAGARVRFAHRREPTADDGTSAVRTLASLALPVVGIVGLLAASLGAFETGGAVDGLERYTREIALFAAFAVSATVAYALTRRRLSVALLRWVPHT